MDKRWLIWIAVILYAFGAARLANPDNWFMTGCLMLAVGLGISYARYYYD